MRTHFRIHLWRWHDNGGFCGIVLGNNSPVALRLGKYEPRLGGTLTRHHHKSTRYETLTCLYFPQSAFSISMMTSSNGNIFRVTGHLCGGITGHRWIPHTGIGGTKLFSEPILTSYQEGPLAFVIGRFEYPNLKRTHFINCFDISQGRMSQ